jgi:amino acid transporter
MSTSAEIHDRDEKRLAELGYKQELSRSWSGFQNFAISFTIISILAGCFTTYGQAWNNGGPIAISWGWPLISIPILIVGFCMSELVSAYPTAGGIYWWASKLGGPAWGWFTGWFNLIGLIAVTASVDYGAATFTNTTFGLFKINLFNGEETGSAFLHGTFWLFLVILALHAVINILTSHLVALFNSISVWWHVAGVTVIIAILIFAPSHHASFDFVFTKHLNNSGFGTGMLWFYVLPLGFLLTQYTITGFDSCAHISEETHGAAENAAKGVWRSIFYSATIGWVLLLAITFAAQNPKSGNGGSISLLSEALGSGSLKAVLLISSVGQLFCGMACLTSASRMCYAFSRDGAIPGWRIWSRVNAKRIPFNAVIFMAVLAGIITIPAYIPTTVPGVGPVPIAFYAVVSIAVIGLYVAYVIPIYLRWRNADRFQAGPWTNGAKYRWMNPFATVWVGLITLIFILPTTPAGVPFRSGFDWKFVNYAPLVTGGLLLVVAIWWLVSAKRTFTGPRHTVAEVDAELGGDTPVHASVSP